MFSNICRSEYVKIMHVVYFSDTSYATSSIIGATIAITDIATV